MAITDLDGLVAAALRKSLIFKSTTTPAVSTGAPSDYWIAGAIPAAGSLASGATDFTGFSSATTGAMPFVNPSSGNSYLSGLKVVSSVAGLLVFYDLLGESGAITPASGAYSWTGSYVTDRPSDGNEVELWGRIATAFNANAHTVTATYLDAAGASKSASLQLPASAPTQRLYPSQKATTAGMKQITALSGSATPPTGTFHLRLLRRIAEISIPNANSPFAFSWDQLGLPRIYDSSCLTFMFQVNTGTSAPSVQIFPDFAQG